MWLSVFSGSNSMVKKHVESILGAAILAKAVNARLWWGIVGSCGASWLPASVQMNGYASLIYTLFCLHCLNYYT